MHRECPYRHARYGSRARSCSAFVAKPWHRVGGQIVLLDCGLFQGKRSESQEKNLHLPLPVSEIGAVVLSHAHIDHVGRLPLLAKLGYASTIFCTPATRDLCAIMLADSAHIQEIGLGG